MIRDPESFEALRDGIARFVKERLVPYEKRVAETDAIPGELERTAAAMAELEQARGEVREKIGGEKTALAGMDISAAAAEAKRGRRRRKTISSPTFSLPPPTPT